MAVSGTPRPNTVNSTNFDRELEPIGKNTALGKRVMAWRPGESPPRFNLETDDGRDEFNRWLVQEITTIHALLKTLAIQSSGESIT
jgi:hypothetical protein